MAARSDGMRAGSDVAAPAVASLHAGRDRRAANDPVETGQGVYFLLPPVKQNNPHKETQCGERNT